MRSGTREQKRKSIVPQKATKSQASATALEAKLRKETLEDRDHYKQVGQRVETFRNVLDISVAEMSTLLSISPGNYLGVLRGELSYDGDYTILNLVETYGLRAEWLLNGNGNPFCDRMKKTPQETYRMFSYIFNDNRKEYDVNKWLLMVKDSSITIRINSAIRDFDGIIHSIEDKKTVPVTPPPAANAFADNTFFVPTNYLEGSYKQ